MKIEEITLAKSKELVANTTWVKVGVDYVTNGSNLNSSLTYWNNKTGQLIEQCIDSMGGKNTSMAVLRSPQSTN